MPRTNVYCDQCKEIMKDGKFSWFSDEVKNLDFCSEYCYSKWSWGWKDIDQGFTKELQTEWENRGFNCEECKEWINAGLKVNDADFANYLVKRGETPLWLLKHGDIESLRLSYLSLDLIKDLKNKKGENKGIIIAKSQEFENKNAQQWVEQNYSTERGKSGLLNLFDLDLSNQNLEGDLDLSDFIDSLATVDISGNPRLGKITTRNQRWIITKNYIDAQEWLEKKYNSKKGVEKIVRERGSKTVEKMSLYKKIKGEITIRDFPNLKEIDLTIYDDDCDNFCEPQFTSDKDKLTKIKIINCSNLEKFSCYGNKIESLDLSQNTKLVELECGNNRLINLDLSKNNQLRKVNCSGNQLKSLILPVETKNLEELYLGDNNFPPQTLEFLAPFVSLKSLSLGICGEEEVEERIKKGIYNRFYGSLEPLKNMKELWHLEISHTDIDSGLEYLVPLKKLICFQCFANYRKEAKVAKLALLCKDGQLLDHSERGIVNQIKPQLILAQNQTWEKTFWYIVWLGRKSKLTENEEEIKKLTDEVNKIKSKLTEDEQEWLDVYCEASLESDKNSFVRKQLIRAKSKLAGKLSRNEPQIVLEKQAKIKELKRELELLQDKTEFKSNIEVSSK